MTRSTDCNKICFNIVELISINMMDICFSNNRTNRTCIRSVLAGFFKKTSSVFIHRGFFSNAKRRVAFSRAKAPTVIFFLRRNYVKSFSARITCFVVRRCFKLSEAFFRAIYVIRVFKPRLEKFKRFSAILTISCNPWKCCGFIGTLLAAKTFFLILHSVSSNLKRGVTYSTCKIDSIPFEFMLAYRRAKKMFVPLNFIRECFEWFFAIRTFDNHRLNNSTSAIYIQSNRAKVA